MRKLLTTLSLTLTLLVLTPASLAKSSRSFDSTLPSSVSGSLKIEVMISDELAYLANHLPDNIRDRGPSFRIRNGFTSNGYYGERDLERLRAKLEKRLNQRFEKAGLEVSDDAVTIYRVTLTDVKPNRPTFEQLSRRPGLSFKSFGVGGASMQADLITADGEVLGDVYYGYYETDIREAYFNNTWSDAYWVIDRFARRSAKTLTQ